MKRFICIVAGLMMAVAAMGQTAQEIVSRMEAEMEAHKHDGIAMTVDVKIPLLGAMSTQSYVLGEKIRMDATLMGLTISTWTDGVTQWIYNPKENELEIQKAKPVSSADSGDAEMFSGITDGYDVTIKKETADTWYIQCKKSKTNKEKDDPKSMELTVAKGSYYPKSLSAKLGSVSMTMRDIAFGVTEAQVSCNPADYPNVKIKDKR